jgi:hypothetical protein
VKLLTSLSREIWPEATWYIHQQSTTLQMLHTSQSKNVKESRNLQSS